MRTGRPPIPVELHRLKGTFRPSRHAKREIATATPGELSSEAPSWMSPSQQQIWKFAVENAPLGLIKPIDAQLLCVWVVACDQHQTAASQQNEADKGSRWPLLTASQETLRLSLYTKVIDQSAVRMIRASSELGFTPVSRPRTAAPRSDAETATDKFWSQFRMGKEPS